MILTPDFKFPSSRVVPETAVTLHRRTLFDPTVTQDCGMYSASHDCPPFLNFPPGLALLISSSRIQPVNDWLIILTEILNSGLSFQNRQEHLSHKLDSRVFWWEVSEQYLTSDKKNPLIPVSTLGWFQNQPTSLRGYLITSEDVHKNPLNLESQGITNLSL